jgi:hypothetical protein
MLAMELVVPGTIEPNTALTAAVNAACHQLGLVTLTAGTYGNVLRFLPPLVIGEDLLTAGLDLLAQAVAPPAQALTAGTADGRRPAGRRPSAFLVCGGLPAPRRVTAFVARCRKSACPPPGRLAAAELTRARAGEGELR